MTHQTNINNIVRFSSVSAFAKKLSLSVDKPFPLLGWRKLVLMTKYAEQKYKM